MIRVLVVDDLQSACATLRAVLETDPEIRVIGQAHRGVDAVRMAADLKPDIVTMDIHMPGGMDGFEATRAIMAACPVPVVMVTASLSHESGLLRRCLRAGAVDVLKKPVVYAWRRDPVGARNFVRDIKILSRLNVDGFREAREQGSRGAGGISPAPQPPHASAGEQGDRGVVVAMASSTGGPAALYTVLGELPPDFPAAILIVQHMAEGFIEGLARSMDERCALSVRMARAGATIEPGVALFAPDRVHMTVDAQGRIRLRTSPRVRSFRPAADLLFSWVAAAYGPQSIGVILTGMLDDGARGIKQIHECGGWTIAQKASTCVVPSMPNAAIALGGVDCVLPLEDIAAELIHRVERMSRALSRTA